MGYIEVLKEFGFKIDTSYKGRLHDREIPVRKIKPFETEISSEDINKVKCSYCKEPLGIIYYYIDAHRGGLCEECYKKLTFAVNDNIYLNGKKLEDIDSYEELLDAYQKATKSTNFTNLDVEYKINCKLRELNPEKFPNPFQKDLDRGFKINSGDWIVEEKFKSEFSDDDTWDTGFKSEIVEKLKDAEDEVLNGRVIPVEEVMGKIREKVEINTEQVMNCIKISDLKTGYKITLRNGVERIVFDNIGCHYLMPYNSRIASMGMGTDWETFEDYEEDFPKSLECEEWDIVKIHKPSHIYSIQRFFTGVILADEKWELVWEEPVVEEWINCTLVEALTKFEQGHDIKVNGFSYNSEDYDSCTSSLLADNIGVDIKADGCDWYEYKL